MDYYFAKDKTPEYRYSLVESTNTATIWATRSTNKFTLTHLVISNNAAAAQLLTFSVGSTSTGPANVAVFAIGASATISPVIGPLDGSAVAYNLYMKPVASATNGLSVTAFGFEDIIDDVSKTLT